MNGKAMERAALVAEGKALADEALADGGGYMKYHSRLNAYDAKRVAFNEANPDLKIPVEEVCP